MKKFVSILLVLIVLLSILSSCVTKTKVTFDTDVPGADVYLDGEYIGKTPVTKKLSNAVWKDPHVTIKKDGYQDIHTNIKKEVKMINLIFGWLLWLPSLLWVHGPKQYQYYIINTVN